VFSLFTDVAKAGDGIRCIRSFLFRAQIAPIPIGHLRGVPQASMSFWRGTENPERPAIRPGFMPEWWWSCFQDLAGKFLKKQIASTVLNVTPAMLNRHFP
jgi:hypothetical protein